MRALLRTIAILFVGYILAVFTTAALGTMDARKLFVLWAIYALLIHGLLRAIQRGSTKRNSG